MQHPVLTCLAPWMEALSIAAHWKGTWCERLLKSMYYVTLRCGRGRGEGRRDSRVDGGLRLRQPASWGGVEGSHLALCHEAPAALSRCSGHERVIWVGAVSMGLPCQCAGVNVCYAHAARI
jgi:hypothetical protein